MPHHLKEKGFPVFATIVLFVGIIWLLQELGVLGSFPWLPIIMIVVGIAMLIKYFSRQYS